MVSHYPFRIKQLHAQHANAWKEGKLKQDYVDTFRWSVCRPRYWLEKAHRLSGAVFIYMPGQSCQIPKRSCRMVRLKLCIEARAPVLPAEQWNFQAVFTYYLVCLLPLPLLSRHSHYHAKLCPQQASWTPPRTLQLLQRSRKVALRRLALLNISGQ